MTSESTHTPLISELPYGIECHRHRFAAWAASRAASVNGCRFKVQQGRQILEECGFHPALSTPEQLPAPPDMDGTHRQWRTAIKQKAGGYGLAFTDGVAAKLLNVYLKCRFVCGGFHTDARVETLHPPIDDVLLRTLASLDFGGYADEWRLARRIRWSKLDSEQYEQVIRLVRKCLNGEPLWRIEQHWKGNQ